jgi:hypothetical protein
MQRKTIEPAGIVVSCSAIDSRAVRDDRDAWLQAHGLCDSACQSNLVLMNPGELVTVLQCHQYAAWDLTTHRIVGCDKEIGDHRDGLLMREALAFGLRGQQCSDEIGSRVAIAPACQLIDIGLKLSDGC